MTFTFPMALERRHWRYFRHNDPKYHSRKDCQRPVDPDISLTEFKCCPYWQRKLSNKWNSRIWASKLGIRVPQLYWHGSIAEIDQIPFESFPNSYVIKPSSGWSCIGTMVMINGINQFDKKAYSVAELRKALKQAMLRLPNSQILVEEMIRNEATYRQYTVPIDFKCFLFGDQLHSILAIRRLDGHSGWAGIYDSDWNYLGGARHTDPIIHVAPYANERLEAPDCLKELVAAAKLLGGFYGGFVRMDFYCADSGTGAVPVFGEVTHFSNMGNNYTPHAESQIHLWRQLEPELFKDGPISGDGKIVMPAARQHARHHQPKSFATRQGSTSTAKKVYRT